MKIAIASCSFIPSMGGYQVFTYNLAKSLSALGHDVDLYLPNSVRQKFLSLKIKHEFSTVSFPNLFVRFPGVARAYFFLVQLFRRYDLWQVLGSFPAGYSLTWIKAPVVLRSYGEDIQKDASLGYGMRLDPGLERKIKKTIARMNRLVALTETVSECYIELGATSDKIHEIPNGIDFQGFGLEVNRGKIRQDLGVQDEEVLLVTVGRYHPKKGYEYVPEAARILKDRGVRFKWLLIGHGLDRVRAISDTLGVTESFVFHPEVSPTDASEVSGVSVPSRGLVELYKSADIFVFPTLLETFGMVIIEAMASGLPVVATTAPGSKDVVKNGVNGLSVEPRDSVALAEAVMCIVEDRELAQKLTKNASDMLREYTWEHISEKYQSVYRLAIHMK